MSKNLRLTVLLLLLSFIDYAQSVAISTEGNPADPSSMLEVRATNKGLLIPRVALTATNTATPVTAPVASLLVYNTATAGSGSTAVTPGFYYWSVNAWIRLAASTDLAFLSSSLWSLTGNAGTDTATNFIGTTDDQPLVFKIDGTVAGMLARNGGTTSWGYQALLKNPGYYNTANGSGALQNNMSGAFNVASGSSALYSNTSGEYNTANGTGALYHNTQGNANTASGQGGTGQ